MASNTTRNQPAKTTLRRLAPPLAFIVALCALVICCYESGYTGLPPTEKRYTTAKANIDSLKQDAKKSAMRDSWENLAREFQSIYDNDPAWPNRPAALFRSAEALEELTRRSCSRADARKAITAYESLALRHASSRLADDALFRAAGMRATWLKDEKGALALLKRIKGQYPGGDMLPQAIALEKALLASSKGKTDAEAIRAVTRNVADNVETGNPGAKQRKDAAGNLPLRFKAAKSRMTNLREDPNRSRWRQPWEDLREEFLAIHKAAKTNLAPQALYQAALCQQILAQCSRLASDKQKALDLYLSLPKTFPRHTLGDDALLAAAKIQKDMPGGKQKALGTIARLLRDYPDGDMRADAKRLQSLLEGDEYQAVASRLTANARKDKPAQLAPAELQVLSWDSPNKNSVQIVLEMSSPVQYSTKLIEKSATQPARLFLNLENTSILNDVRKGVTVQGSLLKAVKVRSSKKAATLQFDFTDVRRFDARKEDNRIILSVAAGKSALPAPSKDVLSAAKKPAKNTKKGIPIRPVSDMASQLGLTVHRVFIDAGHGGKDPGTSHNKIMERMITLDIALAVGRLLTANGLEVVYSRTKDQTVPLSDRTKLANKAKADLFISIHVNANENKAIHGFETYYLDLASTPQAARVAVLENAASDKRLGDMQTMLADVMLNARADESRRLASDIQRTAMFRLKKREFTTRNNGVKSAPFHVLCGAQMPAALVEIGYCSNPDEARNLASPKYRHVIAEGLAEGILAYRDRLLRNHTAGNSLTGKKSGAM